MFNSRFNAFFGDKPPLMLAPLAGVSDHPFRRVCTAAGADLSYVEMLSAQAIKYRNSRTFEMMKRHKSEQRLGVQVTGPDEETLASAVELLDQKKIFETIDLNMGCPVVKVVKTGCGSALLKDPEQLFKIVKSCREATELPLSAKIRLGWDRQNVNVEEVVDALAKAGVDWVTIHGRTRADRYDVAVDLPAIARVVNHFKDILPIIGNGNIFGPQDAEHFTQRTNVAGLMVSRGALGNPWIFREIKNGEKLGVEVDEWLDLVLKHLSWQEEEYGPQLRGVLMMRKHLAWYFKGWTDSKSERVASCQISTYADARDLIESFAKRALLSGSIFRSSSQESLESRFDWDPKWDMDRKADQDGWSSAQTI